MSDAADVIEATRLGRTFRDCRRGIAHLDWTVEQLAQRQPAMRLYIAQPPFNTGVEASAGTHDYSSVYDFTVSGVTYSVAQDALRALGWAAWHRYPPTFSEHIHAISLGYPGRVGVYVPGQVRDYYDRKSGLAGHAADPTWHPTDIDSTVFDYDAWNEAHMPLNKDDLTAVKEIVEAAVAPIRADLAAEIKRADKRGTNTWKRDLRVLRDLAANGATLEEIEAALTKDDE